MPGEGKWFAPEISYLVGCLIALVLLGGCFGIEGAGPFDSVGLCEPGIETTVLVTSGIVALLVLGLVLSYRFNLERANVATAFRGLLLPVALVSFSTTFLTAISAIPRLTDLRIDGLATILNGLVVFTSTVVALSAVYGAGRERERHELELWKAKRAAEPD